MSTIYAVVVTWNAMKRGWIDRCLESLQQSTVPVTPVVVDNGSTDDTRRHVPERWPDAVWLPQEKNLGFGQANNIGICYALEHGADYVLLLNQDAALQADALEKMLRESDGESLLSPLHLNGDGTCIDEIFRYSLRNARNQMNDDLLIRHTMAGHYESGEICAACWLMPRRLIEIIGGFNPLFFHYSEDNNYYHRMVFHGVKTLLVPDAQMWHDRKLQGNMQVFNRKRLRRDLVLEACNINQGFLKCLVQWLKVLFRCYTQDLPAHQYHIGAFAYEMIRLTTHCRTIAKSRKKEKNKGLTWLNL